ncbi:MAG: tetratricopeptide repeat protein [Bryobacteraceae bacterium]|jgi:TolA-binding protein
MNASRLLLLSIALSPSILLGQKHDELVSIQRDVAQLEDQMKQLQKTLDDKMAALTALVQQSIDLSNKTATAMVDMQHNVDQKLSEQSTKLVAPVATLGTKVDEMSGDFSTVRENVKELVRRMNDLDGQIKDISSALRTLAASQVTPPPNTPAAPGGTASQAPEGPPPGTSEVLSYQGALGDYNGKKDETALEEFAQYLKWFPQSANAPNAQFYIGMIYYRGQDWPNAVKAFDAVLEQFPKNSKTPDAQYMKACALMNNHQKTDAGKEFKNFIATYPDNTKVPEAHKHLRELGLEGNRRK